MRVYSPQVLDHFEHPRNSGVMENANVSVQVTNPVCGDVLKLTARVAGGRIAEIKFLAQGCVPAIACASALTELVSGKSLSEAAGIKPAELISEVGGLPPASTHAAALATDALRSLLTKAQTGTLG